MFVGAPDNYFEFQQGRWLANPIERATLQEFNRGGLPQIVRHHDDRNRTIIHFVVEGELLGEGRIIRVKIQHQNICLAVGSDLLNSFLGCRGNYAEFRLECGGK